MWSSWGELLIIKLNGQEFPFKGQLLLDYRATLLVLNLLVGV